MMVRTDNTRVQGVMPAALVLKMTVMLQMLKLRV